MSGYRQSLDNGVLKNPKELSGSSKSAGRLCFSDLVADGDNSKGFTAVTPNGISRMPKDTLVHKDNFGRCEDGAHYSNYPWIVAGE